MAARKKAARRKPAKKAARRKPARKAARKKAAAKKPAKKVAVRSFAQGGGLGTFTGRKASEARRKKAEAKRKAAGGKARKKAAEAGKDAPEPIRMSSLYNERRKAGNMLVKHGQGRRGMSKQAQAEYQGEYDAHKAENPGLYEGPGGGLQGLWRYFNPEGSPDSAPASSPTAPTMMSGGDAPRPDPMAATEADAVAAGSPPRQRSFVPEPAPSSQPIEVSPQVPQISHGNASRPWTAEDIGRMLEGKGRKLSAGLVGRKKPGPRSGRRSVRNRDNSWRR